MCVKMIMIQRTKINKIKSITKNKIQHFDNVKQFYQNIVLP